MCAGTRPDHGVRRISRPDGTARRLLCGTPVTASDIALARALGYLLLIGGCTGIIIASLGGFDRDGWFRRMNMDDFWDWFDAPWVGEGNVRRIVYILSTIEIAAGAGLLLMIR